ncbi:MAG: DHA2 family efflux MFS transporter permease subunit [Pseudomonadota bacterium]|nr:DHA2 family efflux MFS transporter permease subunit [Pseudomonadota bacterium]
MAADTTSIPPMEPGFRRNLLLVTTLFVSVMAAIDMTIVTVALPYMAGSLNATPDEITWVVTMYVVGQAITIGITGHLSRLLGRKTLAIYAVCGFVSLSIACGMAQSLHQIVIFRLLQGAFCGPLIPLSVSLLVDAYPVEERNRVMSLWAMGVMGGPAVGPALGGYLAQHLDWRWNFLVNLPVGVIALVLILRYVRVVVPRPVRTDWIGLLLLVVFLIMSQLALDQGNRLGWFSSLDFMLLCVGAVTGFIAFVGRGLLCGEDNIVNLWLFRDANFSASAILVALLGSFFLALLVLTPYLLINLYGWEVVTAGRVIGIYGIAGILGALVSSRLVVYLGVRLMVVLACLLFAVGWFQFSRINLDAGVPQMLLPGMMIEFALMLVFPLLMAQAFSSLPPRLRDEGAGLFNLTKALGFSFGTTLVTTLVYRGNQSNWNVYGGLLNPANPGYTKYLQAGGLTDMSPQAGAELSMLLASQSSMVTVVQTMEVLAVLSLCAIPLVMLMHKQS